MLVKGGKSKPSHGKTHENQVVGDRNDPCVVNTWKSKPSHSNWLKIRRKKPSCEGVNAFFEDKKRIEERENGGANPFPGDRNPCSFGCIACNVLHDRNIWYARYLVMLFLFRGDKDERLGKPGCRLATLGSALVWVLFALSGCSLTALNFYRTPMFLDCSGKRWRRKNNRRNAASRLHSSYQ